MTTDSSQEKVDLHIFKPTELATETIEKPPIDSIAVDKIAARFAEGKTSEALVIDMDGTLYTHEGQYLYIGKNEETAAQIREKNLSVIIDTARPEWSGQDEHFLKTPAKFSGAGFVAPDVVISGMGMNIQWRNKNGELQMDRAYEEKMKDHKITYKNHEGHLVTTNYKPETVSDILYDHLKDAGYTGLKDIWPDIVKEGLGGVRLYIVQMDNDKLHDLLTDIKGTIKGVKAVSSEKPESNAEKFTGWIHVVPSIAGKEKAMNYVLNCLGTTVPGRIEAHVFGDTNVDVPMLAMGSGRDLSPEIYGHAVANMTPLPKSKLEKVSKSLEDSKMKVQAHVTFSPYKGPDAIYEVVDSID